MNYAIEAENLSKRFGDKQAVAGVDLRVPAGAIYGFLGQNGAGKTTTLRMLLGILEPDGGHRRLLGTDRPLSVAARVGYLPEERGLYPAMTAREAIAYVGALRGMSLAEGRTRADELLAANGLGGEATARIRTFSKGMAQKVQLLATFVNRPDLIVLDEPFSGLDPVNQQDLEAMIHAERARGATILFSTHVMAHAERMCDGLVIIAHGRTRFSGSVGAARAHLPSRVVLVTDRPLSNLHAMLPPGSTVDILPGPGNAYRFPLPPGGIEPLLACLIETGSGIRDMHIERPTLHDAFVTIVGDGALRAETPEAA
ncbi:ABC transporter ATP-binding protein [Sphingosinicella soli]|uniref:ABC-2 type transport system ATP-binding protein n=1 Tax=Sphingosinicella soli TaxID=333708 RepID=A0A7W7F635_9SPHN|nr:ATP-binding cassette domain-containing protein [Sphingosinicella soli]MBB4631264.1 ABC-2 type transport system ATP-binding protein [Sphingosinicella soli]